MSLWGPPLINFSLCAVSFSEVKVNKKFMAMFMGFIDGDGYFDISEQKQYNKATKALVKSTIRIRLASNIHAKDLPLLEYFVKVLGVGKISTMSEDREQVRVIFSKQDLVTIILPLIKNYNLQFLTSQRVKQFALLNYILENSIIHWDNVNLLKVPSQFIVKSSQDLVNLDFFADWLVGFIVAEGSFGVRANGSAFYQIRQTGEEHLDIIKAICLMITGREAKPIKADSVNSYQLTLSSKVDVQKVVDFFSSPNNHPLCGHKLNQYTIWLTALKNSSRYVQIKQTTIETNSNE
jgi:hypothetical protein